MTGADYIARFLEAQGSKDIFLVTGGACAFIVDAISRNKNLNYYPMQHEQSAAISADAVWKVNRKVGVSIATSGPGATNLITGIACSYFDSIPSFHISGQVNQNEKLIYRSAKVRQAGFQETDIVSMVAPITKYAKQVTTGEELRYELAKAYKIATSGRMGPVLIDIPMDIQQVDVGEEILMPEEILLEQSTYDIISFKEKIKGFLSDAKRPLVLFGAGVGLGNGQNSVLDWIHINNLPYVSSWNGMAFVDSTDENYYGNIGVYGNRGANFLLQSCDKLLVLGSRLDNRQRGNVEQFAFSAELLVVDIDNQELKKHDHEDRYQTFEFDFSDSEKAFKNLKFPMNFEEGWKEYCSFIKTKYFQKSESTSALKYKSQNPYSVVERINSLIDDNAIVAVDDGANLCWVYQAFNRKQHNIFTAGGNSPMGYSFPASIGSALVVPDKQVVCFTGDGSIQMCIQEFQSMDFHKLPIKLFVLNNFGYGIIKQFQDTWFDGRYAATGDGYSQPDFKKVAAAYNIDYRRIEKPEDIVSEDLNSSSGIFFDVILNPNTLIEPKIDSGNPLHNMFPYNNLEEDSFELTYIKENK